MNSASITSRVKQLVLDAGFNAVGIAKAEPLSIPMERYNKWINEGRHGMLSWMERRLDEREDVTNIVDGAQSVIVVALNYFTDHQHAANSTGKISRYAWGDDYHDVIPPMLDEIVRGLEAIDPKARHQRYTDTGPVLEKEWAVRAGLGWQGKHSNVIRRDIGSWFFLGVIVTTLKLEHDEQIEDFCGSCTACIDACPTDAILENRSVDATKCLSYWTIEVKPEFDLSDSIAENMDGWLYGCDTCQDVCPWNRFEKPTTESRFEPRERETTLDPSYIVNLSIEEFRERFRKSPMKRPKLAGLQRSAQALIRNTESKLKESRDE